MPRFDIASENLRNTLMTMADLGRLLQEAREEDDNDDGIGAMVGYWLEEVAKPAGIPNEVADAMIVVVLGCLGFTPPTNEQES